VAAAGREGVRIAIPRPGQLLEPSEPPPADEWWRRP